MGIQAESWIMNIIRTLFAWIDYVVYSLIKLVLFGIFDLSNLTTSSDLLNGIYTRIYVLLGVFMAFKLSFSFFQYIIDPESMTGKSEKGVSKLISNVVVMLIALVAIPSILFSNNGGPGLIQRAQNAFLPMLPRLLLGINENSGVSISNGNNTDDISNAANVMAVSSMQAFFAVPEDLDEKCGSGTAANTPAITSLEEFVANVNLSCNASGGVLGTGLGAPKYYKYSYMFIVSTIVGALMVIMLLGITIDIAKRVFKMIILEAIAPIPIMSLIDPKSKKDGAFSHWLKSLISTFLDVFIKLGLLYLILTLIQLIVSNGLFENFPTFTENPLRASYLIVLLILGLIFFAKEAPKFIKDSLGIKDGGGASGTGMAAVLGGAAGFAGGLGAGGLAGGISGMMSGSKIARDSAASGKGMSLGSAYGKSRDEIAKSLGKTQGGMMGALQYRMGQRSAERRLKTWGATEDNMIFLKNKKEQLESEAASAKEMYARFLDGKLTQSELASLSADPSLSGAVDFDATTGRYSISATGFDSLQSHLYDSSTKAETAAGKASSKYEKISKARDSLGVDKDLNKKYNPGYMARRSMNRGIDKRNAARPATSSYTETAHSKGSDKFNGTPI